MRNTDTTTPFIVIYGQEEKSKHCDSCCGFIQLKMFSYMIFNGGMGEEQESNEGATGEQPGSNQGATGKQPGSNCEGMKEITESLNINEYLEIPFNIKLSTKKEELIKCP